ncbi:hypothetical protein [Micromonospora sp. CPCC 206061]|uniref:hypothetical protein n=1 Tax=Micromonospora sp. CPCC 206061 TaxID=3122410 RepID=UPI002FF0B25C
MDTTTTAGRLPAGFLAYGEVVMAAPARPGNLAHRRAARWIPLPVPDGTPAPAAPSGATGVAMTAQRTGRTLVRPACEPEPDPGETTATIGWRENDFWQMSAGWADSLHAARPCTAAQCFPDQG